MDKETVSVFLDYANINRAAREKRLQLDYADLLCYVGEGRFLLDAYCYVPINPRNEHRLDRAIEDLWRSGYMVTTKVGRIAGGTYKCNFDVEITLDVLRVVNQVNPDILVFASGDADFVPLLQEVRKSGVRVEVAAFEETAGAEMLLKCSGFIDLAVYYESYLAAQDVQRDEERREEQYQDLIQSQEIGSDEDSTTALPTHLFEGESPFTSPVSTPFIPSALDEDAEDVSSDQPFPSVAAQVTSHTGAKITGQTPAQDSPVVTQHNGSVAAQDDSVAVQFTSRTEAQMTSNAPILPAESDGILPVEQEGSKAGMPVPDTLNELDV